MIQSQKADTSMREVREKTDELLALIAPLVKGRDLTIVAGVMLAVADTVVSAVSNGITNEERAQLDFQIRAVLSMAQHSLSVKAIT